MHGRSRCRPLAGEGLRYIPQGNGALVRPASGRQIEANGRQSPAVSNRALAYLQFNSGRGEASPLPCAPPRNFWFPSADYQYGALARRFERTLLTMAEAG